MRCDLFHIPEEFPHLLSWMKFQAPGIPGFGQESHPSALCLDRQPRSRSVMSQDRRSLYMAPLSR